uniref:Interleukin family protein n=1 Tax=Malurus cyaneus samueli TaxID=2593467 RepID=A0A8C5X5W4_9PASS
MRTLCSGPAVPILLLLLVGTVPTRAQTSCLHFPELLPTKLREMRLKFEEIKDYFQSKDDDLSIQLLSSDLLQEFKGSLGCQAVSEMIAFYMDEVLPSAARSSAPHQHSVGDLGNLLLSLRAMMRRCHRFFTCEERSRSMKHIKETFTKVGPRSGAEICQLQCTGTESTRPWGSSTFSSTTSKNI